MVSFLGNLLSKAQVYIRTRNSENDANLANDISLKSDETLQLLMEVIQRGLLSKVVKSGERAIALALEMISAQLDTYLKSQSATTGFLNLAEFAPTAIGYRLVDFILRHPKTQLTNTVLGLLDKVQRQSFDVLEVYRRNSQYFFITVQSSSMYQDDKQIRRNSVLFQDIVEFLVQFSCVYLKQLAKLNHI